MKARIIIGNIILISLFALTQSYILDVVPESRVKRNADKRTDLSAEEQVSIIDFHNLKRRTIKASNMQKLFYNEALAGMAKVVGENCTLKHWWPRNYTNQPFVNGYMGQNLYATNAGTFNLTRALNSWWEEKDNYDFQTDTCFQGICGHYTQMIWGETYLIGCAYNYCEDIITPSGSTSHNFHFLVCNYGPAGNIKNAKPYIDSVKPCTRCGVTRKFWCDIEGQWGLCRSDIQGANPQDNVASFYCGDGGIVAKVCSAECQHNGAPQCDCSCQCTRKYKGGYCEIEGCKDTSHHCGSGYPKWYCNYPSYRSLMRDICPETCGVCEGGDQPQACPTLRMAGEVDIQTKIRD